MFETKNYQQIFKSFIAYTRRYGYLLWNRTNAFALDDSPLYWRRKYLPHELKSIVPEARAIYFIREPVERALSCYKYFCLQERDSKCSTEELELRIQNGIARVRNYVCQGTLGVKEGYVPYKQCRDYNPLQFIRNEPNQPVVIDPDQYNDVWPMNDPAMMKRYWWELWEDSR